MDIMKLDYTLDGNFQINHEYNLKKISDLDIGFLKVLTSNLYRASKDDKVLLFKCNQRFLEEFYYNTDIKIKVNTFKYQIDKMVGSGYLEIAKGVQSTYYKGKFYKIKVDGYIITDKFKEVLNNKEGIPTKECSLCKGLKLTSEFGKDSQKPDGLKYKCKVCEKMGRIK